MYIPNNKPLWNTIVSKIKMIPGRDWVPDYNKDKKFSGAWTCPVNPRSEELLGQLGFVFKEEKKVEKKKSTKPAPPLSMEYKKTVLDNVTDLARDYQLDNIRKIKHHNYRLYEASDMGCGKSLTMTSTIREGKFKKVLIVCPSTLKLNLKRECELWLDPKDNYSIHVVRSLPKGLDLTYKDHDICIINNAMLWKHLEYILTEFKPSYVAVDECHCYNTGPTIISKYYPEYKLKAEEEVHIVRGKKTICKKPPKRVQAMDMILMGLSPEMEKQTGIKWKGVQAIIPMSGTPIPHNPSNIYNWLHWLHPERFNDRYAFIDYFCKTEPGYKANTIKITGGKNLDKLNYMLVKDYMVRVTKDEVLKELPKTTRMVIPLELEPDFRLAYDQATDNFQEWIAQNETDEDSPRMQQAKRAQFKILLDLARDGKLKNCFKYVDGLLKTYPDKRYVIFCHHRKVVEQVMNHYGKKAVCLVGGMKDEDKEASVQSFQNDKGIRIFCGNLVAASVGITLHRSDTVIFFETGFSSHIVQQGQDRVRRIGQESDIVQSIFLPAEETIEKYIIAKLDNKKAMSDKAIDGIDTEEEDMLSYLWNEYSKRA
jgi:SNF2 family DNA or RNA helicase